MASSPYEILGIARNASDEEVKKAYREMSRKYHPDAYVDNPLADLAEEKFKQVQEAYEEIIKERSTQYGYGNTYSYGQSGFWGNQGQSGAYGSYREQTTSDYQQGANSGELARVYQCLASRSYREAVGLLQGISNRNAKWYYYSAIANVGLGNASLGYDHALKAVEMEPGNPDYRNLLSQLQSRNNRYNSVRFGGRNEMVNNNNNRNYDMGNLCCDLWLVDTLCECMGGDICRCI